MSPGRFFPRNGKIAATNSTNGKRTIAKKKMHDKNILIS
jgi:hypothetical protein